MVSRSCKQSEYSDKTDVARSLTCYIYNRAFATIVYGWILLTAIMTKSPSQGTQGIPLLLVTQKH